MLGQAWDLLDRVRHRRVALWLGQSPSQWNHSSMPRVQGVGMPYIGIKSLGTFGGTIISTVLFLITGST